MRRCALGPLLGYHGENIRSATVVQELSSGESLRLRWKSGAAEGFADFVDIGEFEPGKSRVWKAEFALETDSGGAKVGLDDGEVTYQVVVEGGASPELVEPTWAPGTTEFKFQHCASLSRMKILFGTCMDRVQAGTANDRFTGQLAGSEMGSHLFLLGGDQVYTDGYIGSYVSRRQGTSDEIAAGIRQAYVYRWNLAAVGRLLAGIPNAMMWDDHDIFDGYGSYRDSSKPEQDFLSGSVFPHARRYFELLQLRRAPFGGDLSWVMSEGNVVLAGLDARSSRDSVHNQVLNKPGFGDFVAAISDRLGRSTDPTLVVVIPIPLVHLRFGEPNWFLKILRTLGSDFVDDLIDNWSSAPNLGEEAILLEALATLRTRCKRMILLSGDSHMGSAGVVRFADGTKAYQVTSSGLENQTDWTHWGITGPGGAVPREDDPKQRPVDGPSLMPIPGTTVRMGMVPVEGNDQGFSSTSSPFLDQSYFTTSRNAVVLDLADGPSVRWILEGSPKAAPRNPWRIP
jgi:hypothetical protein